jgi:hypothetical protein
MIQQHLERNEALWLRLAHKKKSIRLAPNGFFSDNA